MIVTLDNAAAAYDALELRYNYGSEKFWTVTEAITVLLSWNEVIVIEKGFETDLSSVPRAFWNICPPFGDFVFGAVVHDWLYVNNRARTTTKAEADKEMLLWSEVLNPGKKDAIKLFGKTLCTINWPNTDNHLRYYVVRWHPKAKRWWNHNQKWT